MWQREQRKITSGGRRMYFVPLNVNRAGNIRGWQQNATEGGLLMLLNNKTKLVGLHPRCTDTKSCSHSLTIVADHLAHGHWTSWINFPIVMVNIMRPISWMSSHQTLLFGFGSMARYSAVFISKHFHCIQLRWADAKTRCRARVPSGAVGLCICCVLRSVCSMW